jgi:hypothetical protein
MDKQVNRAKVIAFTRSWAKTFLPDIDADDRKSGKDARSGTALRLFLRSLAGDDVCIKQSPSFHGNGCPNTWQNDERK